MKHAIGWAVQSKGECVKDALLGPGFHEFNGLALNKMGLRLCAIFPTRKAAREAIRRMNEWTLKNYKPRAVRIEIDIQLSPYPITGANQWPNGSVAFAGVMASLNSAIVI